MKNATKILIGTAVTIGVYSTVKSLKVMTEKITEEIYSTYSNVDKFEEEEKAEEEL